MLVCACVYLYVFCHPLRNKQWVCVRCIPIQCALVIHIELLTHVSTHSHMSVLVNALNSMLRYIWRRKKRHVFLRTVHVSNPTQCACSLFPCTYTFTQSNAIECRMNRSVRKKILFFRLLPFLAHIINRFHAIHTHVLVQTHAYTDKSIQKLYLRTHSLTIMLHW